MVAWLASRGRSADLVWKTDRTGPLWSGIDCLYFRQNGPKFERVAVHVEHRDRTSVVVANDGALYPGDVVAAKGAYQLQLAIKNKAGGGADPHAGHHH